jgi:predicted nucleic acid-binding protein
VRKLKLYLETSVWNFYYADDAPEKRDITREFFQAFKDEIYEIYISQTVIEEIGKAEKNKKQLLMDLIRKYQPQMIEIDNESIELSKKYLDKAIIPMGKVNDALHAAVSTVYEMDALISWNYKHLANLRRKELIQSVNLIEGYTKTLDIITPMEVISNEG